MKTKICIFAFVFAAVAVFFSSVAQALDCRFVFVNNEGRIIYDEWQSRRESEIKMIESIKNNNPPLYKWIECEPEEEDNEIEIRFS